MSGLAPSLLDPRWHWTRQPAAVELLSDDSAIWTCPGETDFWSEPSRAPVASAAALVCPVTGDFSLSAAFSASLAEPYDQVGVIGIRSAERWLKAGVELDQTPLIGAVVSQVGSDWSMSPGTLPASVRIERTGVRLEISARLGVESWRRIRVCFFAGPMNVGIYSAAPRGGGFETEATAVELRC